MKFLLVVASLVLAVVAQEPIFSDYHVEIGIPEMARIRAAETASDFDGSRIIGGQNAALGAHPFFAGLSIPTNAGTSMCGASIIGNDRAVTAAHCWRSGGTSARSFTVIMGTVNFNSGGVRTSTTNVVMHPNYNQNNLNNDVAVIRMSHVNFNNHIRAIGLAGGSSSYVGTTGTAIGYGRTSNNGGTSSTARQVNLQVIDNNTCARSYFPGTVIASTLCTSNAGGRSTCRGDSGGPLVAGGTLIGITSFGSANGCDRAPAGFARVTSFASWLRSQ